MTKELKVKDFKKYKWAKMVVGFYCSGAERDLKVKGALFSYDMYDHKDKNTERKTHYWKSVVPEKIERILC